MNRQPFCASKLQKDFSNSEIPLYKQDSTEIDMVKSTDSSKSNSIGFPHFGKTMNPDIQGNFVGSNEHN